MKSFAIAMPVPDVPVLLKKKYMEQVGPIKHGRHPSSISSCFGNIRNTWEHVGTGGPR